MWPAGAEDPMGMGHDGPATPSPRTSTTATHSASAAWQSPVPYLFGGLAAMLGLIALSLLALACSYWKLSGSILAAGEPDDDDDDMERQAGGAGEAAAAGKKAAGEHWREHVVVIMAGDERPTFLATPASGRGSLDDARGVAVVSVGCGGGGSGSGSEDGEEGRCVECGARSSWAARAADDDDGELSRSEQSGVVTVSGSSVVSER